MKTLVKTTALAVLAASCMTAPEPQDTSAESTKPSLTATNEELTVYTQTIVRMKDDGTLEVTSKPITLAQEIAESKIGKARAAGNFVEESYALDPGCAGTSEWLYDQPGLVGNRICFSHPSFNSEAHDLAQFTRGSFSCGGLIVPRRWAAGAIACSPATGGLIFASNNTNFVRSIWTGVTSSRPAGVCFHNDRPDGPTQGCYVGDFTQFPDVSTSGRYVTTWGAPLN